MGYVLKPVLRRLLKQVATGIHKRVADVTRHPPSTFLSGGTRIRTGDTMRFSVRIDVFAAAPDCTKISIDERIVHHTCAPLFTVVQTELSS
jgi:hypothetical protein